MVVKFRRTVFLLTFLGFLLPRVVFAYPDLLNGSLDVWNDDDTPAIWEWDGQRDAQSLAVITEQTVDCVAGSCAEIILPAMDVPGDLGFFGLTQQVADNALFTDVQAYFKTSAENDMMYCLAWSDGSLNDASVIGGTYYWNYSVQGWAKAPDASFGNFLGQGLDCYKTFDAFPGWELVTNARWQDFPIPSNPFGPTFLHVIVKTENSDVEAGDLFSIDEITIEFEGGAVSGFAFFIDEYGEEIAMILGSFLVLAFGKAIFDIYKKTRQNQYI